MLDMATAPKNRPILIKRWLWGFDFRQGRQVRSDRTQIVQCWWDGEEWREWCGDKRHTSTAYIDPISWAEVPE